MLKKILDRRNIVRMVIFLIFVGLVMRLGFLTLVEGEAYREKSINNMLKKLPDIAKRGNIYDRNGLLLAGNEAGYVVNLMNYNVPAEAFNRVAVDVLNLLDQAGEEHITFPIRRVSGRFVYRHDENVRAWLLENNFPLDATAEEVFREIREKELISEELDDYEAQKFMLLKGIRLPISVRHMKFLDQLYKENFLSFYGLDPETSARDAYLALREQRRFAIDEEMTIDEALQVMTIRHALHEKGYLKYDPIKIASNISKETAILIEETKMDLPGVSIDIEPIRTYPEKSTAAHVLGYLGGISSESEIATYVEGLGYDRNQLIGKTGIEGAFEKTLTGTNGERYIVVDALGNYLRDATLEQDGVSSIPTKAGEDLHLTLDTDLQKSLETYLERAIQAISVGGTFESKWGDYKYNDTYENAQSGAGVVVNVKTGEVLALASYPAYDVNLFSTGITSEDWQALSPVNPRNPLEARPLYNVATLTAVQPGSTFKMVTGYAALSEGLSATQKIYTNGYIDIGNQRYGCWIWNSYRSRHGPADLYHALETSCNYYFFDVATGYDYYRNRPLPFDMNTEKLVAYAKAFGLDDPTGIEIGESVRGVPDPDKKKRTILALLRGRLEVILEDYFPAEVVADKKELASTIDEILSWADDNPTRGEIIRRLTDLGATDDYTLVGKLADYIKYSHFNFLEWYEGDTFNLAIGQGDHEYTPVQMARYIAALANGGDVLELTLLKDNPVSVVSTLEPSYLEPLREGMRLVAHGSAGTSRALWAGFPIQVGAKTGTAEKEGTIPPLDEVAYLTEHLAEFAPRLNLEAVEERTSELLKERNEELAQLERSIEQTESTEEREAMAAELESLITSGYLNKGSVMRRAIKDLYDGRLGDEAIDAYRQQYDNYSWFVSFAPFDDPEIAVVVMIPQGGSGGYSGPVVREIIGDYFNLTPSVNP